MPNRFMQKLGKFRLLHGPLRGGRKGGGLTYRQEIEPAKKEKKGMEKNFIFVYLADKRAGSQVIGMQTKSHSFKPHLISFSFLNHI
jgi:hypothetical protein